MLEYLAGRHLALTLANYWRQEREWLSDRPRAMKWVLRDGVLVDQWQQRFRFPLVLVAFNAPGTEVLALSTATLATYRIEFGSHGHRLRKERATFLDGGRAKHPLG
jgi:hypothetical protein